MLDFTAALLCYYPASLCILLLQIGYKSTSLFIVNLFLHARSHPAGSKRECGVFARGCCGYSGLMCPCVNFVRPASREYFCPPILGCPRIVLHSVDPTPTMLCPPTSQNPAFSKSSLSISRHLLTPQSRLHDSCWPSSSLPTLFSAVVMVVYSPSSRQSSTPHRGCEEFPSVSPANVRGGRNALGYSHSIPHRPPSGHNG